MSDFDHLPTSGEIASPPPKVNVKRHLIAAALSALVPGCGQFRLERSRRGSILFGAFLALVLCFWPLRLPRYYAGLMTLLFAGFVLFNFSIFDALFSHDKHTGRRLSLGWIPVGLLLGYVGFNIAFTACLFGTGFRTAQNISSSMQPLLRVNDRFVYDSNYYKTQPKMRGDVVMLRRQGSLIIKRIVAIGGDTIRGDGRTILLNGNTLNEPYVYHKDDEAPNLEIDTFDPVLVPSGRYFVMGDKRDISLDSRTPEFGTVSDDMIVGKPLYFYKIGFGGGPLTRRLN